MLQIRRKERMRDDLLNPELFGNEASEDENKRSHNEDYL